MSGIEIKNLTVNFADRVVFGGLDIAFAENEINVILGASGIGKTSLLNVIADLIPYGGSVNRTSDKISYIFQKDRLIPTITVFKNLDLILRSVITDKIERKNKIMEMLELLEISSEANKYPNELSGGQAQRVALARAFLYPSKILLMDEPLRELDTALKSRLIKELIKLNTLSPRTVVFVTHAIDECLLSADKCFVLDGSPANIKFESRIDLPKDGRELSDPALEELRLKLLGNLYS